jgi:purine nucleoside phosphorylase
MVDAEVDKYDPKALEAEAQQFKDGFYNLCERQLDFLNNELGDFQPRLGVVLGSGLGGLAKSSEFTPAGSLPFEEIPGMTKPGTPGHEGVLYWGTIRKLPVMLWAGRVQTTDFLGWNTTAARAARLATAHLSVAKALGVEAMVLTSAAGIIHTSAETSNTARKAQTGDIIAIADYTSFMPLSSPLLAPFDNRFGQRFNGKGGMLDPRMFAYLRGELGERCHVGTYVLSPSTPNFEGSADLYRSAPPEALIQQSPESITVVGMSMAPELDVLISHNPTPVGTAGFDRQVRILAMSLGTNDIPEPRLPTRESVMALASANAATHEEVSHAGRSAEEMLIPAFAGMCEQLERE